MTNTNNTLSRGLSENDINCFCGIELVISQLLEYLVGRFGDNLARTYMSKYLFYMSHKIQNNLVDVNGNTSQNLGTPWDNWLKTYPSATELFTEFSLNHFTLDRVKFNTPQTSEGTNQYVTSNLTNEEENHPNLTFEVLDYALDTEGGTLSAPEPLVEFVLVEKLTPEPVSVDSTLDSTVNVTTPISVLSEHVESSIITDVDSTVLNTESTTIQVSEPGILTTSVYELVENPKPWECKSWWYNRAFFKKARGRRIIHHAIDVDMNNRTVVLEKQTLKKALSIHTFNVLLEEPWLNSKLDSN